MRALVFYIAVLALFVSNGYSQTNTKTKIYVYDTVYVCIHDTLNSRWARFKSYIDDGNTFVSGVYSVVPPYRLHFYKLWTVMRPVIVVREGENGWESEFYYRNGRIKVRDAKVRIYERKPSRPLFYTGLTYSLSSKMNLYLIGYYPLKMIAPFSYITMGDVGFGINVNIDPLLVKFVDHLFGDEYP